MRRLKTIIPIAGILLLILSAASLYVAMRDISKVRPAEDYEDQGVRSFEPYAVYPVQVQNTSTSSRDRRMNPTKTVYMVYYLATDGSGYKWSDEALTRDLGEDIVEAGETVERRVLEIPADRSYITVEPEQTAESYAEGLRGKYTRIIGLSTLYILFYLIILILVKLVNRLRKNRAAGQEVERAAVPRNVSAASQLGPEIGESRRSRLSERWSGWRQEPGGIEVRKPPRIHPRMKLCLFLLAAVFLLFVFQRLGSGDPVDLDYGWSGNTWICDELDLRFTLPAGGEFSDVEELQQQREQALGHRYSAGQTVLAVTDSIEGSTLSLVAVRDGRPPDASLLEAVQSFAYQVAQGGPYQLGEPENLTVAGQQWTAWRIETPERNLVHYYLYCQSGYYRLVMVCYCPLASAPPALLTCFDGENSIPVTPANAYLPPVNEEGYCVFDVPLSLMGNKTQEELLEEWQEDLENVTPENRDQVAWEDLQANEDGGVSYFCTPEQYQRMKQLYYYQGARILPEMFGINPGDIIKRISYEQIDENGVPWGVGVWIDQTAYAGGGSFSDFIAQFVPMTVIGRYQLMCGVPAEEWGVHVTLRDVETEEVLFEMDYPVEGE